MRVRSFWIQPLANKLDNSACSASGPDLAGLPMAMGDTCRMKGDRTQFFTQALDTIKRAKGQGTETERAQLILEQRQRVQEAQENIRKMVVPAQSVGLVPSTASPGTLGQGTTVVEQVIDGKKIVRVFGTVSSVAVPQNIDPDTFWDNFVKFCAQEDRANSKLDPAQLDHVTTARIAALMQVFGPESVAMRKGLVKYLARTSHAEATRGKRRGEQPRRRRGFDDFSLLARHVEVVEFSRGLSQRIEISLSSIDQHEMDLR